MTTSTHLRFRSLWSPSLWWVVLATTLGCHPKISAGLSKKDLRRDVQITTTLGVMVVRLSDSTPLHRDNFLRLAKTGYYDSTLFHRVIKHFVIQGGDPDSRHAPAGILLGEGGPGYTIPAEFRPYLFHRKGALAAARESDDVNPQKASSGSQFYIVVGRIFSEQSLDSTETFRLNGRKIPPAQRAVYKTEGGTPHLDQRYTVFGQVILGLSVVDSISLVATDVHDRPVNDVRILAMKLIRRRN